MKKLLWVIILFCASPLWADGIAIYPGGAVKNYPSSSSPVYDNHLADLNKHLGECTPGNGDCHLNLPCNTVPFAGAPTPGHAVVYLGSDCDTIMKWAYGGSPTAIGSVSGGLTVDEYTEDPTDPTVKIWVNTTTPALKIRGDATIYSFAPSASAATDTTPEAFSFTSITGAALSTAYYSDAVTLTGIDSPAAVTVSAGDKYAINSTTAWTDQAGTYNPGDELRAWLVSSGTDSTEETATVTVGGVAGAFSVTTAASGGTLAYGGVSATEFDMTSITTAVQNGSRSFAVKFTAPTAGTLDAGSAYFGATLPGTWNVRIYDHDAVNDYPKDKICEIGNQTTGSSLAWQSWTAFGVAETGKSKTFAAGDVLWVVVSDYDAGPDYDRGYRTTGTTKYRAYWEVANGLEWYTLTGQAPAVQIRYTVIP